MTTLSMNAQTILKGDMNNDKQVTIADVTALVNVILGKAPQETIGDAPFAVDNSYVMGTWYAPDGTNFTLSEDGTTDFPGGTTYKFYRGQNRLLILNNMGLALRVIPIVEATSNYLLTVDYITGALTYYTHQSALATNVSLNVTTLTINSNSSEQLTATLAPETAFGTITWSSSDESVAIVDANGVVTGVAGGTCRIIATVGGSLKKATCTVTVIQMATSIALSNTHIFLDIDDFTRLTATVFPENTANKEVVWSSSNEDIAIVTKSGKITAEDYGVVTITCTAADGGGAKATCKVSIINHSIERNYVDLGLPSGTLWATCNIGASSPEEYGDYFAWGETEGYNSGKTLFDYSTYEWCENEGDKKLFTKYCHKPDCGKEGFADYKYVLDSEDDAAYVNWGEEWRTPSKSQCSELINDEYTEKEVTTVNGMRGIRITSKLNNNYIFLPCSGSYGYMGQISLYGAGSTGRYWTCSGSFTDVGPYWATTLEVRSTGDLRATIGIGSQRSNGQSIRPVRFSE